MTQQVIKQCPGCHAWRHVTNYIPGIDRCKLCHPLMLHAQEGRVDDRGEMKDSEYESYMLEPITRKMQGQSPERVETALQPYFDMRFPTRRPVTRKKR